MFSTRKPGSFHLFTFRGIDVFLHWSWFVAAVFLIRSPFGHYQGDAWLWSALEYVGLFGLVTLHEFGHALACQQVGGVAHEIVLWPLGGIAFVSPPQRPGATLWSIAAGPLVNVVLAPVLLALVMTMKMTGWSADLPNLYALVRAIFWIDIGLLAFNLSPIAALFLFQPSLVAFLLQTFVFPLNYCFLLLSLTPVYPLDGGQILRSLLWFAIGRARSLLAASIIGFVGVAVLLLLALLGSDIWLGLIAGFVLLNCWNGLRQALAMARVDNTPLRFGYTCPSCGAAPRQGKFWACGQCRTAFDTFETGARCPNCGATFDVTRCLSCGALHPLAEWITVRPPPLP